MAGFDTVHVREIALHAAKDSVVFAKAAIDTAMQTLNEGGR